MISLTQKRLIQIPLFLFIVLVIILPLEWSVFSRLPFGLGPFNVFSILFGYLAITRGLTKSIMLGIAIGVFAAFSFPFAFGAAVAAFAWSTLGAKLLTFVLPFDNRIMFSFLVCIHAAMAKIFWRILTYSQFKGVSYIYFVSENLVPMFTLFVCAYCALPVLILWDDFFENSSAMGSRDISPRIAGMSR